MPIDVLQGSSRLFHRLKNYYTKDEGERRPTVRLSRCLG